MAKEIKVTFGSDIDAVAGWLGSYGGEDSPHDIQRGMFAGEVGVPRLLNLFKKYDIKMTWFIPGHSAETFPHMVERIAEAGHEIGGHGYTHENAVEMSAEQERDVIFRSTEILEKMTGERPVGYITPWWEMSARTAATLIEAGYEYDKSQGLHDFQPFYARVEDSWTKIDYSKPAETWMKPLERGREIDLVELGGTWEVDDLPPMMFNKHSPNSYGFTNPRDIEDMWRDQFDWVYENYDYAVFPFTIHPDVSGRPHVLKMLERLIKHMAPLPGVSFEPSRDIARDFRKRFPFESNPKYPFDRDLG
ncbi:polysaccharide deacetylase [Arthrobacter ginkgonis]|uniref:Polysaccharide deacetylase n=1 Tax=Arthrobacter ginkgonis TaxID=1630594 RepID=A0ABP7CWQ4_9MICC